MMASATGQTRPCQAAKCGKSDSVSRIIMAFFENIECACDPGSERGRLCGLVPRGESLR